MAVICTAGHVDHGKSTLVQALTGTHPDRLKEEREREMTIDLGFAWFELPGVGPVGIVDVPGHRDFIENMLAGVGGVDAALFVIAADEGLMPQTREHLAILDLLGVAAGVVALAKCDTVQDPDWLALVTAEIHEALLPTALSGAAVLPVSAVTGAGIPQLLAALQHVLAQRPARADTGRARLPVDRVFTLPGFGTVVTGTLLGGSLELGAEVSVLPAGLRARVRGLQTHRAALPLVRPGNRVAVNLSGVATTQVRRGDVVAQPDTLLPTRLLDVQYRHLPEGHGTRALRHNTQVKVFVGAAEVLARVRCLGLRQVVPGESGWLQLVLQQPVAVSVGDRFILRLPSPSTTIGGGVVVDAQPRRLHRSSDAAVVVRLAALATSEPAELLLAAVRTLGVCELAEAVERAGLSPEQTAPAVQALTARAALLALGSAQPDGAPALLAAVELGQQFSERAARELRDFHIAYPLRSGMPREELKSRMGQTVRAFNALLEHAGVQGLIVDERSTVRLADHSVRFTAQQQAQVEALLARFVGGLAGTLPSRKESVEAVGDVVLQALLAQGRLHALSAEVLVPDVVYAQMLETVRQEAGAQGSITVAALRDKLHTSRKYALAMLEHLDARGITQRRGDERVLREPRS